MRVPKSKTGGIFVIVYLGLASFLVYRAFTCSDWLCDLVELPATIPFGLLYLAVLNWLDPIFIFGSITYAPFRNWFFIIPTIAVNSLMYYWLGVGIEKIYVTLFSKRAPDPRTLR